MLQQDQSLYITDKGGLRCRPKAANKKKLSSKYNNFFF